MSRSGIMRFDSSYRGFRHVIFVETAEITIGVLRGLRRTKPIFCMQSSLAGFPLPLLWFSAGTSPLCGKTLDTNFGKARFWIAFCGFVWPAWEKMQFLQEKHEQEDTTTTATTTTTLGRYVNAMAHGNVITFYVACVARKACQLMGTFAYSVFPWFYVFRSQMQRQNF